MKKIITLFLLFLIYNPYFSQHTLITNSGDTINGKIIEVNQTEVKYTNAINSESPLYIVNKLDVKMIDYNNGTKEFFQFGGTTIISTFINPNANFNSTSSFSSFDANGGTTNFSTSNFSPPPVIPLPASPKDNFKEKTEVVGCLIFGILLPFIGMLLENKQGCNQPPSCSNPCDRSCTAYHSHYFRP
jgi:hypothetical protein